jgi:hypothetical protein
MIGIMASFVMTARAQTGYIKFRNTPSTNYIYDGSTYQKAAGTNYKATLYYGLDPDNLSPASASTTTFLTGTSAGLFTNTTSVALAPYQVGTMIFVQIRAWSPATYPSYEMAVNSGDPGVVAGGSTIVTKTLGTTTTAPTLADISGFNLNPQASAGIVTTGTASNITGSTATLSGTVYPCTVPTTAQFEYGLTTAYGSTSSQMWLPYDFYPTTCPVEVAISGLQAGTTYHYRLTASNGGYNIFAPGADMTFTTGVPYNYTINNGSVTITGYTGPDGAVTVPGTIGGMPVTTIGSTAFQGCNLTSVTIPGSVIGIESGAFSGFRSLTVISVDSLNASYRSLDGVLFNMDLTTLIQYPAGKAVNYTIPSTVTSIGASAFAGCTSLTNFTIPSTVTSIGASAFSSCTSLNSVTIPTTVTSIGSAAFSSCTSLTNIPIPNSVTSIGDSLFFNCTGLINVSIPNSVISIGNKAFQSCSHLTSVTIPTSVTSIGSFAFDGCRSLASVSIPNSVISIGNHAFFDCSGMTNVTISNSLTSIGEAVFSQSGLTSVIIPNGVTSIGNFAFSICTNLTIVSIPASVKSIGASAFQSCISLNNFTISNSVTSIGSQAFRFCSHLTSVTIPNSMTIIGSFVFADCTSLTQVTIPTSITNIYNGAFWNCTSLASITIPNSVTGIETSAFRSCTSLTSVTIPTSVSYLGFGAFELCSSLTSAYFMGNTPASMGSSVFATTASGFTVYYFSDKTGFTSPTWNGYPAVNMGASTPIATWLIEKGLPYSANLQDDSNGDGVNLLMAYALNLDPKLNLSGSMPKPLCAGNQMSLTFYADNADVTYVVESSIDLQDWSTSDVTLSAPDVNGFRTALISISDPGRFMRIVVSH